MVPTLNPCLQELTTWYIAGLQYTRQLESSWLFFAFTTGSSVHVTKYALAITHEGAKYEPKTYRCLVFRMRRRIETG